MVDPPNCVSDPQSSRLSGHADGPPNFPALFRALNFVHLACIVIYTSMQNANQPWTLIA